LDSPSEKKLVE